jgi:hypothetical protein
MPHGNFDVVSEAPKASFKDLALLPDEMRAEIIDGVIVEKAGPTFDVEYQLHQVFRHDVVGWRRDRMVERPTGRPIQLRPDWVCEILSASNEKRDRVSKLGVLQTAGVPHYWLLDPIEHILVVHRFDGAAYRVALTAAAGETVRAEPFADVELRIDVVFGDEPDEE